MYGYTNNFPWWTVAIALWHAGYLMVIACVNQFVLSGKCRVTFIVIPSVAVAIYIVGC